MLKRVSRLLNINMSEEDDDWYEKCLASKAAAQAKVDAQQLVVDDLVQVQTDLQNKMTELSDLQGKYESTYGKTRAIGEVVGLSSDITGLMDSTEECLSNMATTLEGIKATCDKDLEKARNLLTELQDAVDAYPC